MAIIQIDEMFLAATEFEAEGLQHSSWKGRWAIYLDRPSPGLEPVEQGETEIYTTRADAALRARAMGADVAVRMQASGQAKKLRDNS
jgi:hypothetical protein